MANEIERLGRFVSERRKELGLSQIDVWQSGGPSNSTLTGIETGSANKVSRSTLRKLERSLMWAPGSAQVVLDGGEPDAVDVSKVPAGTTYDESNMSIEVPFKPEQLDAETAFDLLTKNGQLQSAIEAFEDSEGSIEDVIAAAKEEVEVARRIIVQYFGGADSMRALGEALLYTLHTNGPGKGAAGSKLGTQDAQIVAQPTGEVGGSRTTSDSIEGLTLTREVEGDT